MANYNHTELTGDNPQKFDEIMQNVDFKTAQILDRKPGGLFIKGRNTVPHDELKEMSAKHPDITLKAEHSFEHDLFRQIYHIKYKAGIDELIKVEPNYMMPCNDGIKDKIPCYDILKEKLFAIFKRLDIQVGEGIDWVNDEVAVTVEHNGWKIKATKEGHQVTDMRFYAAKKIEKIEWQEIFGGRGVS